MFLALFNRGLPAVNRARTEQGLPPLRDVLEHFDRVERVLVLTSESFDFHGDSHPQHVRYVGPTLADPSWVDDWRSPWTEDDSRPLVVVSLSSTYMAQEKVLARVIEGLGRLDARVLVTTGPTIDPASLRAPNNTAVVRSAPHAQLFPEAAVVVTHAGMGTVTRALAAGVPLVCVPMGRDQLDVAARVVHAGAGVRLRAGAKPAAIRAAVERVMRRSRLPHRRRTHRREHARRCRSRTRPRRARSARVGLPRLDANEPAWNRGFSGHRARSADARLGPLFQYGSNRRIAT